MDTRAGFREITDGWMLVDDQDDLLDRIERIWKFRDLYGALSSDEVSTVQLMLQVFFTRMTGREDLGARIRVKDEG